MHGDCCSPKISPYERERFTLAHKQLGRGILKRSAALKIPHDGFAETIRLTTSAHNLFEEVRLHVCHCLYEEKSLEWIGFTRGAPLSSLNDQQMQVEEYVDMVLELAKNRAWAKMDYTTPPLAYAGIASATIAV